jgi:hypothetical protein
MRQSFRPIRSARSVKGEAIMGEHEHKEAAAESPFERSEKASSTMGTVGDAAHALYEKAGFPQALRAASSTYDLGSGIHDMTHGNVVDGGIKAGKGAAGLTEIAATLAEKEGVAGRAGMIGAGLDVASGMHKFAKGDVMGGVEDSVSGGLGFVPGVGSAASAAWKGGLAIGHGLDNRAAENDTFGGHRTAHEAAADTGVAAEEWLDDKTDNHTLARIGGGAVTIGAAVVDTGIAAAPELIGGVPAAMIAKQRQEELLHHQNLVNFAQHGAEWEKTNPYVYSVLNSQYGDEAKAYRERQAMLAQFRKLNPAAAEVMAHYVD